MTRPLAHPARLLLAILFHSVFSTCWVSGQTGQSAHAQHQHETPNKELTLFPARETSGTAWLPDETAMFGYERALGSWRLMFHGTIFGQFLYEPGYIHRTGGFATNQGSSVNWLMVMGRRPLGSGRLGLRAMLSGEPWTVSDCGFINLLANGERCDGDTIHDRQHPHDLFMELAANYEHPVRGGVQWDIYAGLAGEPALGPPAFAHRPSAMPNPVTPIAHHWLDSSHITHGLVTTGLFNQRWKAELSVFNGREPDEERADLDLDAFDSVSGRVSFMPTPRWVMQVSAAHLNEAEQEFASQPRTDVDRFTASAIYHRTTPTTMWATTFAYGVNASTEIFPGSVADLVSHAGLVESHLSIRDRHSWFGRLELVGKPGHDLHVHEAPAEIFVVSKLQAGYAYYFEPWKGMAFGIGGTGSLSFVPEFLASRYEGRVAPGMGVFLNVRPGRHAH